MKRNRYPKGWNARRVRRVLEHYERQSDEEAMAEDDAAWCQPGQTVMSVPSELVSDIRDLIEARTAEKRRIARGSSE